MSVHIQPVEPVPYIGVNDEDIAVATTHGVAAGLKRHRHKSPDELADAALEIMEAVHLDGYKEKVEWFASTKSQQLYASITTPAKKAEFSIRLAKMLSSRNRREWSAQAQALVSREEVVNHCSKRALVTLALLYAEAKNLDQTLTWLKKAQAAREDYRDAAHELYAKGASKEGLQVMREGYGEVPYSTADLVVLISYGLSHPEILNDPSYKEAVLSFEMHWQEKNMTLKALCHLGHVEEAIELATQLSLMEGSTSVDSLLILAKCIHQAPQREKLVTRMIQTAFELKKQEARDSDPLYFTVLYKHLTNEEAFRLCDHMANPINQAVALWNRACKTMNKWGAVYKRRENRDSAENLNLQMIFKEMRKHLMRTEFTGASTYWLNVITNQIKCGFFEDVEETASMWREWINTRGYGLNHRIYNADDLLFLAYQFLFELLTGRIEEGKASLKMSRHIHREIVSRYPHEFTHNYRRIIGGTAFRLLCDVEIFDAPPETIELLKQLYNRKYTLDELLGDGIDSPFPLLEEAPH